MVKDANITLIMYSTVPVSRQWSLTKLADYGFDPKTGIWAECPGYSNVVLNDYTSFATLFDRNLNYDLMKAMPVLSKAVALLRNIYSPTG